MPSVLEAYCSLRSPAGGWKLIIVDNGSTDLTKQVIRTFEEKIPVTYLFEAQRGKNVALNIGLLHVDGDLIVLTDDDAVPHPDWEASV